jgi:uncharacterized OB-fold protein
VSIGPVARDTATAEFFDGARAGKFLLRRRRSTGEYCEPQVVPAPSEESDFELVPSGGGARIVSWATVHGKPRGAAAPARTVVGIVELDEGPWWWTQLVDVDPDADLAGLRVHVEFVPSGDEPEHEVVPVFRPERDEVGGDR